jgi:hypothetical protein
VFSSLIPHLSIGASIISLAVLKPATQLRSSV